MFFHYGCLVVNLSFVFFDVVNNFLRLTRCRFNALVSVFKVIRCLTVINSKRNALTVLFNDNIPATVSHRPPIMHRNKIVLGNDLALFD